MEYVLFGLGVVLLVVGAVGCVVPVIPGPLLAYCSLFTRYAAVGPTKLTIGAVTVVTLMIADYAMPVVFAKGFKCTTWGIFGCTIGAIAGLFFMPLGIVVGPFLGAVLGEMIAGRNLSAAVKGGFGALVGFAVSVGFKFAAVALFAWWFFAA